MSEPSRPDLQATVARLSTMPRQHPSTQPAPDPDWEDVQAIIPELGLRRAGAWTQCIPSRFVAARLEDLCGPGAPPAISPRLCEWAIDPRGRNLILWGPVGCGKTHAAVAACREAHFDRGQDVAFRPVVELLDSLRPDGNPEAMEDAMTCDVLVLDDLGGERPTDWTGERLYAIVNRRWLEQRPVVATTNLPLSNKVAPEGYTGPTLEDAVGSRTFSRLVGNGAVVLRLGGPDRRR